VQGTVRAFDSDTRGGTLLLDDGLELPYTAEALWGSGLLHLRVGQRVRISLHDDGRTVRSLTHVTFPDPS
jgi:hypothetical protein